MSRFPAPAILDGTKKVTVLQSPQKHYFDVLVVRKGGKESRQFVHRSRIKFIPRTTPADTRCGVVPPPKEPDFLQDELPLG